MTPKWALLAIGRREHSIHVRWEVLRKERVLVTGALGSIGAPLLAELSAHSVPVRGLDVDDAARHLKNIDHVDLAKPAATRAAIVEFQPTVILHLAGAKHAPAGEEHPEMVAAANVLATANVLDAAHRAGARVVTSSTCKACNPETAYGASKLLAERMTLAAGGTVIRFHNVVDSAGNVFEIWRDTPDGQPLWLSPECERYFITRREAIGLALWAAASPAPGRYMVDPGDRRVMYQLARSLYPGRAFVLDHPRRGDRTIEPYCASNEHAQSIDGPIHAVTSSHDLRT